MFQKGIIKNYNADRGFGFIRPESGGKDLFFHIKDFPAGHAPQLQARISYWVEQTGDKFAAKNITLLDLPKAEIPAFQDWQVQPVTANTSKPITQHITQNKAVLRSKSNPYVLSQKPIQPKRRQHNRIGRFIGLILTVLVVAVIGRWGYGYLQHQQDNSTQQMQHQNQPMNNVAPSQSQLYAAIQAPPQITEPPKSSINGNVVQQAVPSGNSSYQCDGRTHCSQMRSYEEAVWFIRNCPNTKMDGNNDGEPCENDSRW